MLLVNGLRRLSQMPVRREREDRLVSQSDGIWVRTLVREAREELQCTVSGEDCPVPYGSW